MTYATLGHAIKHAMAKAGIEDITLPATGKYMYLSEIVGDIVDGMMAYRDGKHLGYERGDRMSVRAQARLDRIDAEIEAHVPHLLSDLHTIARCVYVLALQDEIGGFQRIEQWETWPETLRLARMDAWQEGRTKRHLDAA